MDIKQLRKLILETVQEEKRTRRDAVRLSKTIRKARLVLEGEEETPSAEEEPNPAGFAIVNPLTNISDLDTSDAFKQLSSGDESMPLIKAMQDSTDWASGAMKGAGGGKAIKKWVDALGEKEFARRVKYIVDALPADAPAKPDMPALEGGDAVSVQDALSPGGDFNIDMKSPAASQESDFDKWFNELTPDEVTKIEDGSAFKKNEAYLREEKYPRYGMGSMPGSSTKGEKEPPNTLKDIKDKALAFLTKGKLDGIDTDDDIEVKIGGTVANKSMIPTQSNVLAAKSLLFGFLQGTGNTDLSDMGGAFITSNNEILDGHHRWSGAYIGTGGIKMDHGNVNVVTGDADELIPMLVSVGNALGRKQKGVEEEVKESNEPKGDILLERWSKLAGLIT